VDLVKRIPVAAGLGGGSSDAAAALRLANRAWGLDWDQARLTALAAEVGSDVPFFLDRGPAVCRGRGERVERLSNLFPLHFVIVKPRCGLNTGDVYRALERQSSAERVGGRERLAGLLQTLRRGTWSELGRWMGNRLEAAAATLSPWVEQARSAFAQLDFVAHQLAGSGSAYFGVCRHAQHARRLATILWTRQFGLVYVTRSC
jgi:4-diphosphocytidyl-2-C-methyl-D-erythritol kinase